MTILSFENLSETGCSCVWPYQHRTSIRKSVSCPLTIVSSADIWLSVTQVNSKEKRTCLSSLKVIMLFDQK